MNLVIKDAVWQIIGRVASALFGFLVIKLITPYLGPLRYGDYTTILKYFAIWSALADFGVYVIALKHLGNKKAELKEIEAADGSESSDGFESSDGSASSTKEGGLSAKSRGILSTEYSKFFSTRMMMIVLVYTVAILIAYLLPAYTQNPFLVRGLPFGMIFSASFMTAGMLQVPVQLFWKMEQLSIGLVLARIGQIGIILATVYWLYPLTQGGQPAMGAFLMILVSVVASGVIQGAYVRWQGKKFLSLRWEFDWSFTKGILGENWQYGLAYYLSSFHTLVVLILLSWFYPTVEGYTYVGIWALGLSLIEILLVVPSSLGNSLIHKVSSASQALKRINFGHLCFIVTWIGGLVTVLFYLFSTHIINFLGGIEFLTQTGRIGSDFLLPWFGIIITLSFIKQVHNYLFVSTGYQNTLLMINLVGVVLGLSIAVPLLLSYGLMGGLVAQGVLEILFVLGALFVARKKGVLLKINWRRFLVIGMVVAGAFFFIPKGLFAGSINSPLIWIGQGALITAVLAGISIPRLRDEARGL